MASVTPRRERDGSVFEWRHGVIGLIAFAVAVVRVVVLR